MKIPRTVYLLRLEATGKMYIGSTAHLYQRFKAHYQLLERGLHPSKNLQADYDRSEDKTLTLTVLEDIRSFTERGKEYKWMEHYRSFDPVYGYNCSDPHFYPPSTVRRQKKLTGGTP